jgi:hypothetical protein
MRHLELLGMLHSLTTPVDSLSAIPLFPPKATAARHFSLQDEKLFSLRIFHLIEALHIAAESRIGTALKSCASPLNAYEGKVTSSM